MKYRAYSSETVELINYGNFTVAFDRHSGRYFSVASRNLPMSIEWEERESPISSTVLVAYVLVLVGAFGYSVWWMWEQPVSKLDSSAVIVIAMFVLIGIVLHEAAHVLALRCLGRRPDAIGFKLNYKVLPAVYVRMNQSLLLPRRERFLVHSAGIFINSIMCAVLAIVDRSGYLPSEWRDAVSGYCWIILLNAIPVLNTDGQKMMIACIGQAEPRYWRDKSKLDHALVILSIVLLLSMVGRWIFVLVDL